jgi:hypothetical protein
MITETTCFLLLCIVCCLLFCLLVPSSIRLPSTGQQQAPLLFCSGPQWPPLSTPVVFSLQFTNAGTRLAKQVTANQIFSFPTNPSVKSWVVSNALLHYRSSKVCLQRSRTKVLLFLSVGVSAFILFLLFFQDELCCWLLSSDSQLTSCHLYPASHWVFLNC